jgi:hypothetical protein
MMRTRAVALLIAISVPTLAAAQAPAPPGHPGPPRRPPVAVPHPPGRPPVVIAHPPGRPAAAIPHPPPHLGGPVIGPGRQFTYRGHTINRVHLAPFVYPRGFAYRRWAVGAILPPLFLAPAYYYADWAALGLDPPQPGFQWVRYGPDLLLVNVTTGAIVDVVPGVFD